MNAALLDRPAAVPSWSLDMHCADRAILRAHLSERDGGVCHLCGRACPNDGNANVDHVLPKSLGGSGHPMNLAMAHRACNSDRGNAGADSPRMACALALHALVSGRRLSPADVARLGAEQNAWMLAGNRVAAPVARAAARLALRRGASPAEASRAGSLAGNMARAEWVARNPAPRA